MLEHDDRLEDKNTHNSTTEVTQIFITKIIHLGQCTTMIMMVGFNVAPGWLLADLFLHVVISLCLFHPYTGGLVATVVASRVSLVDLWTLLIIK